MYSQINYTSKRAAEGTILVLQLLIRHCSCFPGKTDNWTSGAQRSADGIVSGLMPASFRAAAIQQNKYTSVTGFRLP
jgi:hypothetical protein